MRAGSKFMWVCLLAIATVALLTFTAPLLPGPLNLSEAEQQRSLYAAAAIAVAVVAVIGLLVLRPLWRQELAALRPARLGLATFAIALVATIAAWTALGALAWGVVAPLPRRGDPGAETALTVTALWFAAVSALTAYGLWSAVRRGALRPVLASPIGDGGLRSVTGTVRAHVGAVQLTDPVTRRPSVAWVLDVEQEFGQSETEYLPASLGSNDARAVRKTRVSHKRHQAVARTTTTFFVDSPVGSLYCDDPNVRVTPTSKVTWEEGDPPLPPLPPDITEHLRRRNFLDARFGSRSISPGDTVTAVGLVVVAEDGVIELRATPSVVPRFWLSPLHGIRAHVAPATRRAVKRLRAAAPVS